VRRDNFVGCSGEKRDDGGIVVEGRLVFQTFLALGGEELYLFQSGLISLIVGFA
jgi:hypothetical protein